MNLCIDIGNSFIKYAVFKGDELILYKRVNKLLVDQIKKIKNKHSIESCILSTTRKTKINFENYLSRSFKYIRLDHSTKLPFKNSYSTPKTLGKDRLAAVAGAQHLFPKKNCLVFDIGTCMTADLITKEGIYLGGNISPGKDLRIRSMHDYTSALPLVRSKINKEIIAKTTVSALQNGANYGLILEIEALARRIKREMGQINVILTGGDALRFGEFIECKKFVEPNLVLVGLNTILKYNE